MVNKISRNGYPFANRMELVSVCRLDSVDDRSAPKLMAAPDLLLGTLDRGLPKLEGVKRL